MARLAVVIGRAAAASHRPGCIDHRARRSPLMIADPGAGDRACGRCSAAASTTRPLLVQHLGLVLAMFGAVAAERHGHLATLGNGLAPVAASPRVGTARRRHFGRRPPFSPAVRRAGRGELALRRRRTRASGRRSPTAYRCGGCRPAMPARLRVAGAAPGPSGCRRVGAAAARCGRSVCRCWVGRWPRPSMAVVLPLWPALVGPAAGGAGGRADLRGAGRPGAGAVLERRAAAGVDPALALPDHRQPVAAGACRCSPWRGWSSRAPAPRSGWVRCSSRCSGAVRAARWWRPHCCARSSPPSPAAAA